MADEVVRPHDVLADGLRDDLVDAIKYAYMAKGAIESGDLGGVAWRKKDGGEWQYVVELNFANDCDIVCDSDGNWQEIEDYVDSWIDPWVKNSPDPTEFTNQINSLATVARQLYVGNAPAPGSRGAAPPCRGSDQRSRSATPLVSLTL